MLKSFGTGCAVILPMIMTSSGAGAADVVDSITGPAMQALMQDWGYRAKLGYDDVDEPEIETSSGGYRFYVYPWGCDDVPGPEKSCNLIYFWSGFESNGEVDAATVNAWNADAVFGRGFIDHEDDAVLEMIVPMAGGVTEDWLQNLFLEWENARDSFASHIGF